ncbi:MAG: phytanoyl-CoA dioxygenase family protein [Granulosicoccus sp.]
MTVKSIASTAVWLDDGAADVAELYALCKRKTDESALPLAAELVHEVPVYEGDLVRQVASAQEDAPQRARALQQEWTNTLLTGAGAVVVRNAIDDLGMLDQVTDALNTIIARESSDQVSSDHFAAAGSNTRLWNAHEKLAIETPELFAAYNANDTVCLMSLAWLGPGYQITTQANIVHPGGKAQVCHRDYHMGFQQEELLYQYPAHVHRMSPMLTLQGAIAHSDMPIQTGPTQLLPFSQNFVPGYLASGRADCRECFQEHFVQLDLNKGDMLFFSPALMHAAGDNNTKDTHRFANLMQISSAYGRAMEFVDRGRMSIALYAQLQSLSEQSHWNSRKTAQVVAACAEAYPFPANTELEPPIGGLAPESQQALMFAALREKCTPEEFAQRIHAQQNLKRSH